MNKYIIIKSYSKVGELSAITHEPVKKTPYVSYYFALENLQLMADNLKGCSTIVFNENKSAFMCLQEVTTEMGKTYQVLEYRIVEV